MQFKANIKSYFILGFMLMVLVAIPAAVLMMFASAPLLIGGALAGGIVGTIMMMAAVLLIGFVVIGWLTFRFVRGSKFG